MGKEFRLFFPLSSSSPSSSSSSSSSSSNTPSLSSLSSSSSSFIDYHLPSNKPSLPFLLMRDEVEERTDEYWMLVPILPSASSSSTSLIFSSSSLPSSGSLFDFLCSIGLKIRSANTSDGSTIELKVRISQREIDAVNNGGVERWIKIISQTISLDNHTNKSSINNKEKKSDHLFLTVVAVGQLLEQQYIAVQKNESMKKKYGADGHLLLLSSMKRLSSIVNSLKVGEKDIIEGVDDSIRWRLIRIGVAKRRIILNNTEQTDISLNIVGGDGGDSDGNKEGWKSGHYRSLCIEDKRLKDSAILKGFADTVVAHQSKSLNANEVLIGGYPQFLIHYLRAIDISLL